MQSGKKPTVLSSKNAELIKTWKTNGETIVFTNGCFDVIHPGHFDIIQRAKALGDRLVVGLNSDDSIQRLKGIKRPIIPEQYRYKVLCELRSVDLVIIFEEDTPVNLIEIVHPDILVKGADYSLNEVVGREIVESYGGKVVLLDLVTGFSTTDILSKLSDELLWIPESIARMIFEEKKAQSSLTKDIAQKRLSSVDSRHSDRRLLAFPNC